MSNYPPGTNPNDPHLTGDWPCQSCHGVGCWYCTQTGRSPEVEPACPSCGATEEDTVFFLDGIFEGDYVENESGELRQAINVWEDKSGMTINKSDTGVLCMKCGDVTLA